MNQKIINLINELNKASELYYNGKESFLSDKEYDSKLEELKKLEQEQKIIYSNSPTINVGAPVLTELNKIQIQDKPMLSLDKVHSAQEIIKFSDGNDLIATIKCDGLSVRLIYKDTDLISANTRGNGYEGSDITEHIKHFLNVPLKIAKTGIYIIDGEAIIYDNDFAVINKNGEFKNNRNTASGALSLLDLSIVDKRKLSFIAWDIIKGGCSNFYHYNLEEAEELGFTVSPGLAIDCTKLEKEEIDNVNKTLLEEAKEKGIPCDGIVWKINDINEGIKKGSTAHHFLNAVAWKPTDELYDTKLKYIDWTMGRTGTLCPVAVFEPIDIDDSIVERASLHNYSVMREVLGSCAYVGEPLKIYRANMIIPQVKEAGPKYNYGEVIAAGGVSANDSIEVCPCCGGPVSVMESAGGVQNVVCENPNCEGKLQNRIDHFFGKKGLDVKGISKATIEKLIDWGWVSNITDMYYLDAHKEEWIAKKGFGEKSVIKILDAIWESQKNVKLVDFIAALGIPLIGKTVAKEIVKIYDTWDDFRAAVGGDWTEFDGFGPEMSKSINKFNYSEADELATYFTWKSTESAESQISSAIKNKTFCITGKLTSGEFKNRDALKADIESRGGKVVGSMSSKVNYLINNDNTSTTAKNKAAQAAGISIITEAEYLKMRIDA